MGHVVCVHKKNSQPDLHCSGQGLASRAMQGEPWVSVLTSGHPPACLQSGMKAAQAVGGLVGLRW